MERLILNIISLTSKQQLLLNFLSLHLNLEDLTNSIRENVLRKNFENRNEKRISSLRRARISATIMYDAYVRHSKLGASLGLKL